MTIYGYSDDDLRPFFNLLDAVDAHPDRDVEHIREAEWARAARLFESEMKARNTNGKESED